MTLYVVPTPLGNLEDITLRALRVLKEVRAVCCEDTRRTRTLLTHFEIHTPCIRYNEHDPRSLEQLLGRLAAGEALALVSDGGSPVISDPGVRLISRARAAGIPVVPLPGPCAAATAVAGSGLPGDSFVFLGFLPRSEGRRLKALRAAAALEKSVVVYEAPNRMSDLLRLAAEAFGPDAQAAVARELSKVHEEWTLGTVREVGAKLANVQPRGEFAVVFHPRILGQSEAASQPGHSGESRSHYGEDR